MHKYLLGVAAALAVGAPAANAETTGHLGLSLQSANIEWGGGGDTDIDYYGLNGAVAIPLHDGWNLQFDASHSNYKWDGSTYRDGVSTTTLHAFNRNDSYAFGGYVGFGNIWGDGVVMLGVEGQFYLPNATIDGAIQYADVDSYSNYTGTDVRVGGSYFLSSQFALNGTVSYTDVDDYDTTITAYGVGGEYRFTGSAFSVGANYLHEDWDYSGSDADADIFSLRLTYDFGTGSLQERSQDGASFDSARPFLESWTRWD